MVGITWWLSGSWTPCWDLYIYHQSRVIGNLPGILYSFVLWSVTLKDDTAWRQTLLLFPSLQRDTDPNLVQLASCNLCQLFLGILPDRIACPPMVWVALMVWLDLSRQTFANRYLHDVFHLDIDFPCHRKLCNNAPSIAKKLHYHHADHVASLQKALLISRWLDHLLGNPNW